MDDLIEALQIFRKHLNLKHPTNCDHDVLCFMGVTREQVSDEDHERLYVLGFLWSEPEECYRSFRFGSA
jgi:hypothetical protein